MFKTHFFVTHYKATFLSRTLNKFIEIIATLDTCFIASVGGTLDISYAHWATSCFKFDILFLNLFVWSGGSLTVSIRNRCLFCARFLSLHSFSLNAINHCEESWTARHWPIWMISYFQLSLFNYTYSPTRPRICLSVINRGDHIYKHLRFPSLVARRWETVSESWPKRNKPAHPLSVNVIGCDTSNYISFILLWSII